MGPYSKKYKNTSQASNNSFSKLSVPQGLPNIGNICFLNSILQQLFYLEKLREQILNRTEQYQQTSLSGVICQLFASMKNRDPIKLRQANLRKIQEKLQQILLDYEINCQFDSLQTVIAIINEIVEENPELQSLFKVQYTLNCQCSSEMFFSQLTIEGQTKICSGCQQKLKRRIQKLPLYLLCHGSNSESFQSLFEDSTQKNMTFTLLSKNIYIGNKESGHYYSICYLDEKVYKFNDKNVTEYNENSAKEDEKCVFSVFQVTEKQKSKTPLKRYTRLNKDKKKKVISTRKSNISPNFQRIVYVELESKKLEQFKNDQRIAKVNYIPTLSSKQTTQIERPALPMQYRFTIFIFIANFFHRIFELLSNRLKPSFIPSYTYPQLPTWNWPRCMNFAKNIRIFSSLRNLFSRKTQIANREIPILLT